MMLPPVAGGEIEPPISSLNLPLQPAPLLFLYNLHLQHPLWRLQFLPSLHHLYIQLSVNLNLLSLLLTLRHLLTQMQKMSFGVEKLLLIHQFNLFEPWLKKLMAVPSQPHRSSPPYLPSLPFKSLAKPTSLL